MYAIMKSPDDDVVLLDQVAFEFVNRVILQPIGLVEMVIKSRFMCDDEVCFDIDLFLYHLDRCKHCRNNAGTFLIWVAGLDGINCIAEWRAWNFLPNQVDDLLNGEIGRHGISE